MRIMPPRRVNEIEHIGAFLYRWLAPAAPLAPAARSRRSRLGNINLEGSVGASRSALLARNDPDFLTSVEPGVRALVDAFITIGSITYTSCEGHDYGDSMVDEHHVGVLLRNEVEACRLESIWRAAESVIFPPLELGLMRHSVACQGRVIRAMDFYLTFCEGTKVIDYFAALPAASAGLAAALVANAAEQGRTNGA